MHSKQTALLMDCFDLLADIPLRNNKEQKELAQSIIDTLGNYPKPQHKNEEKETNPTELGAYLYTSTARNFAKLFLLGYTPFKNALNAIISNLENALGLLTDERK